MVAGPPAGFGDAERDRLTIVLREHYALGRLDEAEFDRRLGIVLSADHAEAAAAALAGLPPLIPQGTGQPGQAPASGRRSRRRHAMDRMIENARLMGGNAVVAMRFDSSEIGQGLTEIVAYGTSVVVRPAAG